MRHEDFLRTQFESNRDVGSLQVRYLRNNHSKGVTSILLGVDKLHTTFSCNKDDSIEICEGKQLIRQKEFSFETRLN
jgi:hypothetical protein